MESNSFVEKKNQKKIEKVVIALSSLYRIIEPCNELKKWIIRFF